MVLGWRHTFLVLMGIGVFVGVGTNAHAQANAIMTDAAGVVSPGASFQTDVEFAVSQNVLTYQAAIQYDPAVLTYASRLDLFGQDTAALCNDIEDPPSSGNKAGVILCSDDEFVSNGGMGVPPVSGTLKVLTLTFSVASGTSASSSTYEVLPSYVRPSGTTVATIVYNFLGAAIINSGNIVVQPGTVSISQGPGSVCNDDDSDGHADPAESTNCTLLPVDDCNDTCATCFPGGTEVCDGLDNNCVGGIDENAVDALTWYQDQDSDTFGDPNISQALCSQPGGFVSDDRDCNDNNSTIHPNAIDVNDGIDNNCDGKIDETNVPPAVTLSANPPSGVIPLTVDFTCSATDGNGDSLTYDWIFGDGNAVSNGLATEPHTYLSAGMYTTSCTANDGFGGITSDSILITANDPIQPPIDQDNDSFSPPADCQDNDNTVYPGATEIADGKDNDCDGQVDEGIAPPPADPTITEESPITQDPGTTHVSSGGCGRVNGGAPFLLVLLLGGWFLGNRRSSSSL